MVAVIVTSQLNILSVNVKCKFKSIIARQGDLYIILSPLVSALPLT